ncbi:MAG TPA: hypothetical protein VMW10_10575 [Alphaproteobacteria bacterium]|nr:hypothetical protein [Alphaproteobacteria bacterium]
MQLEKIFLTALIIGIVQEGALQAVDVTINYKGPGLSTDLVIPESVKGTVWVETLLKGGINVDLHNPTTNEHDGFTYSYPTDATTIGPVKYAVSKIGNVTIPKNCTSSLDNGTIPVTNAEQKTLKKVIVNLTAAPIYSSNEAFDYSCRIDAEY